MTPLVGTYQPWLVVLSITLAILASGAAFDLAGRVAATTGWPRALWLAGGAGAMGLGIWSMHYAGMLAFELPVPIALHIPTVALSLAAAILAAWVALFFCSRPNLTIDRVALGSVAMGAGILTMFQMGMSAMRVPATIEWDIPLVALSIVVAVAISGVALRVAFRYGHEPLETWTWRKVGSAVLMGAAIPGSHYTGMAAATFVSAPRPLAEGAVVSPTMLGTVAITATTVMVLGVAIAAAELARHHQARLQSLADLLTMRERQLEQAQAIAHVGSWEWEIATNRVTWSAEIYHINGLPPSVSPSYEGFVGGIHPDDRERVERLITQGLAERRTIDHEARAIRPDGELRHVLNRNVVLLDGAGRPTHLVGTSLDITDLKRAEEALARSERYHRTLMEQALDLTWLIDAEATIRYASPSHEAVLGYRPEDLLGHPVFDYVHPDDLETLTRVHREAAATPGAVRAAEFRFRHADGSWRHLEAKGRNLFDDPVIQGPSSTCATSPIGTRPRSNSAAWWGSCEPRWRR